MPVMAEHRRRALIEISSFLFSSLVSQQERERLLGELLPKLIRGYSQRFALFDCYDRMLTCLKAVCLLEKTPCTVLTFFLLLSPLFSNASSSRCNFLVY